MVYSVAIKSEIFIAHSLDHPDFGPAQNLHGATLGIQIQVYRDTLNEKGVVIDIDLLNRIMKTLISRYNYKNLDQLTEFEGKITSIEFLSSYFCHYFQEKLENENILLGKNGINRIKVKIKESSTAMAEYEEQIK